MADDIKTYQPGWEKHKERKHHHHHHVGPNEHNRGLGGALRMRDKQAYYGLIVVLVVGVCIGLYVLVSMFVREIKAMPKDDPTTERNVDALRIRKADERDALLYSDSLTQVYNLDSLKRNVQIETRPVYRPPRRENTWYITEREWKDIWKTFKIWRRNKDKDEDNE